MLKRTHKLLIIFSLCLLIFTTFSYATNEIESTENTNVENNLQVTSESGNAPGDNARTISEPVTTSDGIEQAISEPNSNEVTKPQNTYISNSNIQINDDINDNLFILADEVTINSDIVGDVFIIANKVVVTGSAYIYSNLFVCANEVEFNGLIAYDLYGVCSKFTNSETSLVYRNLCLRSSEINLNGRIKGNAYLNTEILNFSSKYGTCIFGDLNYSAKEEVKNSSDFVTGKINYSPLKLKASDIGSILLSYAKRYIQTILFVLVIVIAFLWIANNFTSALGELLKTKTLQIVGIGIGSLILIPIISIILLITSVGASIGVFSIGISILLVSICLPTVSISIAKALEKRFNIDKKSKFVLLTLVVASILWILSQIPYLSIVINFVVVILGMGLLFKYFIFKRTLK